MRLFTAILFPDAVLNELEAAQAELKRHLRAKRWQPLHNAHLTVHFLGPTPEALVPPLDAALAQACREAAPFELELGGIGAFPTLARSRVLWLGVGGETERLMALERSLRPAVAAAAQALDDRPYTPHITLARDPERTPELGALPRLLAVRPLRWRVEEVVLFQSELRPDGAVHTVLGRYPLLG